MAKTTTEVQPRKPEPTTYNHCGVIIRVPDTARFEASLDYGGETFPVGLKDFATFDEFKLYCEDAAAQIRQLVDRVSRCDTELRTSKRVLAEKVAVLGVKDGA